MESRKRKRLMSAAYRFSFARLSLNYYSFCESMLEEPGIAENIRGMEKEFGEILEEFLRGEDGTAHIDDLRRRATKRVERIAYYKDFLSIYDYVLSRMERRFEKRPPIEETPEGLADRIVKKLRDAKDAASLGEQLRTLEDNLPIRYTRQRFYGMVMDKLTVYNDVSRGSIENLLYLMRSAALLEPTGGMEEGLPKLDEAYTVLRNADYRNMDQASYESCRSCLDGAQSVYVQRMGPELEFVRLLSDLYVLFLSRGEAIIDAAEDAAFRHIVMGVREHFSREHVDEIDDQLTESLRDLEGIQESAYERIIFSEDETDADLKKMELLLSSSLFAKLEDDGAESVPADRKCVEDKGREFCSQLDESFRGMQVPVKRAVMAAVLAHLPMTFSSMDEIREHVVESLASCADFAEREFCMENLERELLDGVD